MAELASRGHQRWSVVWDPFVRIFHWSTVGLVAVAFFSDANRPVHDTAGYIVLALVVARIAWGLIGSAHARFSDFLAPPGRILAYLRDIPAGRARRYIGHNPTGGAMIVALLSLLVITAGSGWLSETDAFFGISWVSHLHHRAAHLLLVLAGLHVLGVVVSSLLHRENLVVAMITGRKRTDSADARDTAQPQAESRAPARPAARRHATAVSSRNLGDNRQA
jgi:cytochrome b